MRSSILIILHAQILQARVDEQGLNRQSDAPGTSARKWLDNLFVQVAEKLVDRTLKMSVLHHTDLDMTTLAKTHPDMSYVKPYNTLPMQVARAPFVISRSSLPFARSSFSVPRSSVAHHRSLSISLAESGETFPLCTVAKGMKPASGPRVPVWLFRQAGRHLPEYREFMAQRNNDFNGLLVNPTDVAEVTLQPQRRYALDAAILFSDILVIPQALGINIEFPGGNSVKVNDPILEPRDMERLPKLEEASTPAFIEEKLGYVLEAIQKILEQMQKEGFGYRPLIGFSAAPWTILFFMVGAFPRGKTGEGERWCKEYRDAAKELLTLITKVTIEYLSAQARAGAHALQVFEAMALHISPEAFEEFAMPSLIEIAREVKARHPGVPLMVFPRGASYALGQLQTAGYDVVTVDTQTDLAEAAQQLREEAKRTGGRLATLQGNFNPRWLQPAEGGTPELVREKVREMLDASGALGDGPMLIANLGEGLGGKESPELVNEFVNAVHEMSSVPSV